MNKLEIINTLQRKGITVNDLIITESRHCYVITLNPNMDKLKGIIGSEYPMAIIYMLDSENGELAHIEIPLKNIIDNEACANAKILELFNCTGILVDSYEAYSVQDIYNITSDNIKHIHNVLDKYKIDHCYITDVSIYISKTVVDEFLSIQEKQKEKEGQCSVTEMILNKFNIKYKLHNIKDVGDYELTEISLDSPTNPMISFYIQLIDTIPGCTYIANMDKIIIMVNKEYGRKYCK